VSKEKLDVIALPAGGSNQPSPDLVVRHDSASRHLAAHGRLGHLIRGDWFGCPVGPDDRSQEVAAIHRSLYKTSEGT
jgi:hypothetical protein